MRSYSCGAVFSVLAFLLAVAATAQPKLEVTPDVFDAFGKGNPNLISPATFRELQPLAVFRHADGDRKIEAARHLVVSEFDWDRHDAVRFLVEEGNIEVLSGYLQPGPFTGQPLMKTILYWPRGVQIFAQIRRMGYRVDETPDGLAIVRHD